jgi:hypothetical protein
MPRQAGSCLSSQTLGIGKRRAALRGKQDEKSSALCASQYLASKFRCRPHHRLASGIPRQSGQGFVPFVVNTRAFSPLLWHLYVPFVRRLWHLFMASFKGSRFVLCARARFRDAPSVFSSVLMPLIQFPSVPRPLPNHSIERTSPGKPGAASHLER